MVYNHANPLPSPNALKFIGWCRTQHSRAGVGDGSLDPKSSPQGLCISTAPTQALIANHLLFFQHLSSEPRPSQGTLTPTLLWVRKNSTTKRRCKASKMEQAQRRLKEPFLFLAHRGSQSGGTVHTAASAALAECKMWPRTY